MIQSYWEELAQYGPEIVETIYRISDNHNLSMQVDIGQFGKIAISKRHFDDNGAVIKIVHVTPYRNAREILEYIVGLEKILG